MRSERQALSLGREERPRIIRQVLPNGLQMILLEDHSAPVVAFQFWVRFGSADENPHYAGVAHVFEHMLFKGTEKYPRGEIGALIEGAGGVVNAWTSYDETVYHVTLSSRYWETALDVLVDAILNSRFDSEELNKEIEVVQEEIRRGKDNPDREITERLLSMAFEKHPYKRPVIGYPQTVSRIVRDAVLEIYHTWYVPNNMIFVAVGDFSPRDVSDFIQKRFQDRAPVELPVRPRERDPRWKEQRFLSFSYPADLYRIELAFYGVEATDPRAPALDLLSDILSNGYNSLLYRRLKREDNLALEIFSYNYTPVDPGIFSAGASFHYEQYQRLIPRLVETIFSLRNEEVSSDTLALAKTRVISQFIHNQETYQGIARLLGEFTLHHGDPYYHEAYIAALERLEPRDLKLLAEEIFTPNAFRIALLNPEGKPLISEDELRSLVEQGLKASERKSLFTSFISSFATSPQSRSLSTSPEEKPPFLPRVSEVESPRPNVRIWRYPGGPTLVVQQDRKAPLVTVRVTMTGGQLFEPRGKEGIASLTARLLNRGTVQRSASELEDDLDRIGAVYGVSSDRDAFTISMRVPKEHFLEGWHLFLDLLLHPTFPESELERERQDQLRALKALPEQKFTYAFGEFLKHFYAQHPYDHLPIGTEEGVRAITREDIISFYERHLERGRMVFSFVGDLSFSQVEEIAATPEFASLFQRSSVDVSLPTSPQWRGFEEKVLSLPGNQTHILWGFPTVSFKEHDRYPLSVLDAILSGMGGRLFVELRDRRSLAYAVSSIDAYPLYPGFMLLYIGCAPEKEEAAISGFVEVLDDIRENGVKKEELERAQRYLTGTMDVSLQSTWNRSATFAGGELFHGKWNIYEEYIEEINKLTSRDIQAVVRKYLNREPSLRLILRAKKP